MVKKGIILGVVCWMLQISVGTVQAQRVPDIELTTEEIEQYEQEVRSLVSFFQFMCNAIGDSYSTPQEKDIVISQTYLKAFRDEEVQVEDDLVEERRTVTNKNIQAYLKDIDFFFTEARFDLGIEEVSHFLTDDGVFYFKVAVSRNLQATTLKGDTINVTQPRFIEVNLNPVERDLKIVSIYTTKVSEAEALTNWWNELSGEWQYFLGDSIRLNDTLSVRDMMNAFGSAQLRDTLLFPISGARSGLVTSLADLADPELNPTAYDTLFLNKAAVYAQLRELVNLRELDIADESALSDLSAIGKFTQLRNLNIAGTAIQDLGPLRNLTKLEFLDISRTGVNDLQPLRYAIGLREFFAANTSLIHLTSTENFTRLEVLDVSASPITDISALVGLNNLREVNLSGTAIQELSALVQKNRLELLNISQTKVGDLSPLANLKNLQMLDISGSEVEQLNDLKGTPQLHLLICDDTRIRDLTPLASAENLERVYCDRTEVNTAEVLPFMQNRPEVLVVYQTASLENWWKELDEPWLEIMRRYLPPSGEPGKDELQELANLKSINIDGVAAITSLEALTRMPNLTEVRANHTQIQSLAPLARLKKLLLFECAHTPISDLLPLMDLQELKFLDVQHTAVSNLSPLSQLKNLRQLNCDDTPVEDLSPLSGLESLDTVYCDNTQVTIGNVRELSSNALIVFQSGDLETWWARLPAAWKKVFQEHVRMGDHPSREKLNEVAGLRTLNISGNREITNLSPLKKLYRLSELSVEDTRVSSLAPVADLSTLKILKCSRSPVADLDPLRFHKNLRMLNIENTPVEDLEPLTNLTDMEDIVCAGTQVKDLKPLEGMGKLVSLDISNTGVRSLKPLELLSELRSLLCFNSRIGARQVARFRQLRPEISVVHY